ncbi:hypothetical protein E4V99_12520 [Microbacterium sp. dk485]|uniref:hypothetical protein n=1 Tax=Microbacterium sp. dk485 TaxID=2560021 RepID=UPI00107493AF|nr:hypothetical protein [Microbacterium sp. dk485]TFV81782.1 hypothetical protein E4V99_12520 [Microbacterium sp. dk485]
MSCAVAGCTATAQAAIILPIVTDPNPEDLGPWSVTVCKFHEQALYAGEHYDMRADGVLNIGTNAPPRLLAYEITETGLAQPVLTLHLGHDGVVDQQVPIQVSPELVRHLAMNEDSELAKETGRNSKPEDSPDV